MKYAEVQLPFGFFTDVGPVEIEGLTARAAHIDVLHEAIGDQKANAFLVLSGAAYDGPANEQIVGRKPLDWWQVKAPCRVTEQTEHEDFEKGAGTHIFTLQLQGVNPNLMAGYRESDQLPPEGDPDRFMSSLRQGHSLFPGIRLEEVPAAEAAVEGNPDITVLRNSFVVVEGLEVPALVGAVPHRLAQFA